MFACGSIHEHKQCNMQRSSMSATQSMQHMLLSPVMLFHAYFLRAKQVQLLRVFVLQWW